MPDDPMGLSLNWPHHLEDMLGLVIVAAVVGAYSLLFALTRRPWQGWAITALVAFAAMTALIWASPPRASCGKAGTGFPQERCDHPGRASCGKAGTGFPQERCDRPEPPAAATIGASIPDG
jgi:hypothetical protein